MPEGEAVKQRRNAFHSYLLLLFPSIITVLFLIKVKRFAIRNIRVGTKLKKI